MISRKSRAQTQKKVIKKRFFKVITALATLFFLSTGMTYSWFTSDTESQTKTIKMGSLNIEATFSPPDLQDAEPGTPYEFEGTLTNTGTLDAFIKLENRSTITFINTDTPVEDDKNVVQILAGPDPNEIAPGVKWYKSKTNERYVELPAGKTVKVKTSLTLDGANMSNDYQGAAINVLVAGKATQTLNPAMKAFFGINLNDLSELK